MVTAGAMCGILMQVVFTFVVVVPLDQYVLLGCDEGIYTLNLNEIHEGTMELVRCLSCGYVVNLNKMLSCCQLVSHL